HQRVLRLRENGNQFVLGQLPQGGNDRQAADEFRDQAEVKQVFRLGEVQDIARGGLHLLVRAVEAERAAAQAALDDVLQADESTAADEEDFLRIHLDVLLLGVLAASLRRHVADGALQYFQQGLLNALAGHVAGDRDVVRFAADLVDFIDVDDTALGALDVEIGGLKQAQDDVLHILA